MHATSDSTYMLEHVHSDFFSLLRMCVGKYQSLPLYQQSFDPITLQKQETLVSRMIDKSQEKAKMRHSELPLGRRENGHWGTSY
jgi:hypothetical protein